MSIFQFPFSGLTFSLYTIMYEYTYVDSEIKNIIFDWVRNRNNSGKYFNIALNKAPRILHKT